MGETPRKRIDYRDTQDPDGRAITVEVDEDQQDRVTAALQIAGFQYLYVTRWLD